MTDNKRFEIMNTLMRMNRKMASRGPKQGGPMLGRAQMMMVKEIIDNPGISQDQIAEKLSVDKTTIAKAIKKLEEHGMITREKSREDSRKYAVTATDKALRIRDRVKQEFEKRSEILFKDISDDEIEAFGNTLKKIEGNIEKSRGDMQRSGKWMSMPVIRTIIHKPGITEKEIAEQTEVKEMRLKKALEILKEKELIRIDADGIYPTDKALENKKMRGNRKGRPDMPGKRKR